MRSLLVILLIAVTSYHFCDVWSGAMWRAVLMPLLFVLSLLALVVWLTSRSRDGSGSHTGTSDMSDGISASFGSSEGVGGSDD